MPDRLVVDLGGDGRVAVSSSPDGGFAEEVSREPLAWQDRGRLDEAQDWYRQSLGIEEELGNRPGMASSFGQFGLLAEARHQPRQALEWMVRGVTLFDQFPHPMTGPGPSHLARLTRELGMPALEEAWLEETGQPLPQPVRDYITSQPDEAAEART